MTDIKVRQDHNPLNLNVIMKRLFLLFFLVWGFTWAMSGQTITVKGTVLDENQEPAVGATVRLKKDPSKGTVTNMNGEFTLQAERGELLVFSYIGYDPIEVAASANMRVLLRVNTTMLNEFVKIGYATRKTAATSASVVKVSSDDLVGKPSANILDATQGKVAGLQVISSSGEPSQTATLQLHGNGSLGASSEPLYILDGMPVSQRLIRTLNPNDFESVQFLKDAAATSIYGARAANGVVYFVTKKGRSGDRARVSANAQYGISTLATTLYYESFANTDQTFRIQKEYGLIDDEMLANLKKDFGMNETEWYKILFQDAPTFSADVNVSGAKGSTDYYISAGYFDQEGLMPGSMFRKGNLRVNVNTDINKYVRLGINSILGYSHAKTYPAGGSINGALSYLLLPYYPIRDKEGNEIYDEFIPGTFFVNPRYERDKSPNGNDDLFVNSIAFLTIKPFKGMEIRSQAGITFDDYTYFNVSLPSYLMNFGKGKKMKEFARTRTFTTNTVAEYRFDAGEDHHFSILGGQEYTDYRGEGFLASGTGLSDDRLTQLQHLTEDKQMNETFDEYALLSFFTQLGYDYQQRYFVDAVLRSDSHSRFGANKRTGVFWSLGMLWKAKNESFLSSVDWLDALDLRLSTGTQGNAGIGNYDALALATVIGQYKGIKGRGLSNPGNPNLGWESQRKSTLGFTLSFLQRYSIVLELYDRLTSNMLMDVPQPLSSGLGIGGTVKSNVGKYSNRGIDLALRAQVIKGEDYGLSLYTNFNYNRDKVVELF